MDRSGAPWRVLDDAVPATRAQDGEPRARDVSAVPRLSLSAIAGLIAAAALAIGAFAIAATGPSGEITVDGGAAWTGSGAPSQAGGRVGPAGSGAVDLVIDVQGAVLHPGVLRIGHGSRVADAIAAAGGYSPRVDAERAGREVNLAAEVHDGDRIVVPSRDDPAGSGTTGGGGTGTSGGGLIDLNSASAEELDTLPGVGPVTAQKIIDARPFASVEDLRDRKVVGSSTFEKLQALVTVR